ncbi:hypothetical protein KSS87_022819, partial [Heliosperma pusillum]
MNQGRLIVHTRRYNATMEDSLFTQGVTMQTMGNEARKTHCHTRSYNATMGNEARKTHCS